MVLNIRNRLVLVTIASENNVGIRLNVQKKIPFLNKNGAETGAKLTRPLQQQIESGNIMMEELGR